jgi:hypothetical protein
MVLIFMFFLIKEDFRSIKHNRHKKEIEKRKKAKELLNESKSKS